MTYDAATGTVVLFGGYNGHINFLRDTWTGGDPALPGWHDTPVGPALMS